MSKITFRAYAKEFNNGWLLLPATPADKAIINGFASESCGKYITVTANYAKANKTYDQCKTVFGLINILFESNYDRKPTKSEQEEMYRELLEEYADKEPSLLHKDKMVPIPLSKMSKSQAASFINSLLAMVTEYCQLTDQQQIDVKTIFQEFQEQNNAGENNPIDYDKEGNLLNADKWCERNNISMASGINDGTLEIAHIITKNLRPDLRDYCWNWLRLTHYEHIEIQHRKSWTELLDMFPHLIPRVKEAYDKANELYPIEIQRSFIKAGLMEDYLGIEKKKSIEKKVLEEEDLLYKQEKNPGITTKSFKELDRLDWEKDYGIF